MLSPKNFILTFWNKCTRIGAFKNFPWRYFYTRDSNLIDHLLQRSPLQDVHHTLLFPFFPAIKRGFLLVSAVLAPVWFCLTGVTVGVKGERKARDKISDFPPGTLGTTRLTFLVSLQGLGAPLIATMSCADL